MPSAIMILAPGFEETEAVTTIDLIRRGGIDLTILGLESREVTGSHWITIMADRLLQEFSGSFDALVLPGGMPGSRTLASSEAVLCLVKETFARGALCAAVCAAPIVFGKAGILTGLNATCYPGHEKELTGATVLHDAVVCDRNVITSRGVGTAIPFALEIVSFLANKAAAEKVGADILYSRS